MHRDVEFTTRQNDKFIVIRLTCYAQVDSKIYRKSLVGQIKI